MWRTDWTQRKITLETLPSKITYILKNRVWPSHVWTLLQDGAMFHQLYLKECNVVRVFSHIWCLCYASCYKLPVFLLAPCSPAALEIVITFVCFLSAGILLFSSTFLRFHAFRRDISEHFLREINIFSSGVNEWNGHIWSLLTS